MAERVLESVREQYRYELLTWPEINEAVAMKKVVLLPVGATEQHGPHLPLDTDFKLASAVANEAGRRSPEDMVVMPAVPYGYTHHVQDFPGTINIEPSTFTCASRIGLRVLTTTLACAAWWQTTSGRSAATILRSASPSRMSTWWNAAPAGTRSRLPADRSSTTSTVWPSARSASAT